MNIEIKDNRVTFPLNKISYGECFQLAGSTENYRGEFIEQYFMKIRGIVSNKLGNIMFVDIKNGETYSLPQSTLVCPIQANVEVEL